MNTQELPSADTIRKFVRAGLAPRVTHLAPIEKGGTPVAQEPAPEGYACWIDITPAMAANWLNNNFGNRPVSDDVVLAYARDMINGTWRATHQGIAFNDEDRLIDGQHRLRAIVRANVTVRMMVTFGLPSKIAGTEMTMMDCVDRGRTRSVSDQLKIQHGLKNGTAIAQVSSALAHLCFGERVRRLSVGQTLDIYREFQSSMDFVIEHRSKEPGLKSAGVLAAFAFVMQTDDACFDWGGKFSEMFTRLNSDDFQSEYLHVARLRAVLTSEEASGLAQSMNKGLAELVVHVLWREKTGAKDEEFSMRPADWLLAVDYFRGLQQERVDKIAKLFKLPALVKVEPVVASPATTPRTPAQPAAPAAPPAKDRPTIEKIFGLVESHYKISRFIITGRGHDLEIDSARIVFIYLARGAGHTAGVVAAALKSTEERLRDLTLPLAAMSTKQKKAVEIIKAKL